MMLHIVLTTPPMDGLCLAHALVLNFACTHFLLRDAMLCMARPMPSRAVCLICHVRVLCRNE